MQFRVRDRDRAEEIEDGHCRRHHGALYRSGLDAFTGLTLMLIVCSRMMKHDKVQASAAAPPGSGVQNSRTPNLDPLEVGLLTCQWLLDNRQTPHKLDCNSAKSTDTQNNCSLISGRWDGEGKLSATTCLVRELHGASCSAIDVISWTL